MNMKGIALGTDLRKSRKGPSEARVKKLLKKKELKRKNKC